MLYNKQWEKPEVKTEQEWREILLSAADLIDCFGWVQGESGNPLTGFCAIGAIEYVTPDIVEWQMGREAMGRLRKYLGRNILHWNDSCDVPDWNDSEQRTKQEVVDAMRAAAKQ